MAPSISTERDGSGKPREASGVLRTTMALGALSAVLSGLSFVNQLVIARTFGVSLALDAYFQATSFPFLLTGVLGGVFAYAMVPALVHGWARQRDARALSGGFLVAFALLAISAAAIGSLGTPVLLRLLGASARTPELEATARAVAMLAWWSCALSVVSSYLAALANAGRRFFTSLIATAFPYAGSIAACLVLAPRFGVRAIAIGLIAGYATGVTFLLATLRRDLTLTSSQAIRDEITTFFRGVGWVVVAMLPFSAYLAIDAFWAPRVGPAALSTMGYAQRLFVAIGSLVIIGPTAVLQPRMADAVAAGRMEDFQRDLSRAIRMTLAVTLPVAAAVSVLRIPVVTVLFQRGAFTAEATRAVASVLPWMMLGMVGNVCLVVVYKAAFALRDHRTVIVAGLVGPVVYFTAAGVLSWFAGLQGLGAANVVLWWALFGLAWFQLRGRSVPLRDPHDHRFWMNLGLGLGAVMIVAWVGRRMLIDGVALAPSVVLEARLAVVALAAALAFAVSALVLFPVAEIGTLARALKLQRGAREMSEAPS